MTRPERDHDVQVVSVPSDLLATRLRRVAAGVACIVAGLCIVVAAGIDLLWPVAPPKLIGAEATAQRQKEEAARLLDGTLADLVEEQHRLRSRTRRWGLDYYLQWLFRFFGEANPKYVVGREGALFLRVRLEVVGDAGAERAERIGRSAGVLRALSRRCAQLGSRLIVVPIPRKAVIMADLLPAGVDPRSAEDIDFFAALRREEVPFVDLLGLYSTHQGERVYSHVDTHWSSTGMVLAAWETARQLLDGAAPVAPKFTAIPIPSDAYLITAMLGIRPEPVDWLRHRLSTTHFFDPAGLQAFTGDPPDEFDCLVVGTSFSRQSDGGSMIFVKALSAGTGQRIWNAALVGSSPTQSLAEAARRLGDRPLPAAIVFEMPLHFVTSSTSPLADAGQVFVELPVPTQLQSLWRDPDPRRFGAPRPLPTGALRPGRHELVPAPGVLARVLWDGFVYPRDGTVAVRLRGDVSEGPVRVEVDRGFSALRATWRPGRREVLLPLAGDGLGAALDVLVRAQADRATLQLDELDLVTDLDLAGGVRGVAAEPEVHDDGFEQELVFAATAPAGDDCVGVELTCPGNEPRVVAVTARFTDGAVVELFGPAQLQPKASLLLPLSGALAGPMAPVPAAGRVLAAIVVRATGPPPESPIRAFHLRR